MIAGLDFALLCTTTTTTTTKYSLKTYIPARSQLSSKSASEQSLKKEENVGIARHARKMVKQKSTNVDTGFQSRMVSNVLKKLRRFWKERQEWWKNKIVSYLALTWYYLIEFVHVLLWLLPLCILYSVYTLILILIWNLNMSVYDGDFTRSHARTAKLMLNLSQHTQPLKRVHMELQ